MTIPNKTRNQDEIGETRRTTIPAPRDSSMFPGWGVRI
jgi:hypothetical protein